MFEKEDHHLKYNITPTCNIFTYKIFKNIFQLWFNLMWFETDLYLKSRHVSAKFIYLLIHTHLSKIEKKKNTWRKTLKERVYKTIAFFPQSKMEINLYSGIFLAPEAPTSSICGAVMGWVTAHFEYPVNNYVCPERLPAWSIFISLRKKRTGWNWQWQNSFITF